MNTQFNIRETDKETGLFIVFNNYEII